MAPHGSLDHPDQPLPLPPRPEAKETAASALAALDEDKCAGSFPRMARGCPGKVLRRQKWRIATSAFVLVTVFFATTARLPSAKVPDFAPAKFPL
jgi:hypothetical protein